MPADGASPLSRSRPFRVGDRTVFPQRNRILGPAGEIHLEPRVVDVLCVMAAQAGEVLSREALINDVWEVQYGGDESLTRAISILRKALGAGSIETIAKRGYRFAAPVDRLEAGVDSPTPATTAAAPAQAPMAEPPRPNRGYALRQQGRGPNSIFPVASLDFWRLPALAFAVALALALGIGAADLGWPGS